MGRYEVRLAVTETVANAGVIYVGTVYPARPTYVDEKDYTQQMNGVAIEESESGSACVVVTNIESENRNRYGLVGRGAMADWNKHIVLLELFFSSLGGEGIAAQLDYDQIVDALMQLIRENPTMSAPAAVWSAGEYVFGVKHEQSAAYTSGEGLAILINGRIRFEAWEQIVGSFVSS